MLTQQTLEKQTILDAAHKAYRASMSTKTFAAWLEAAKQSGFYWSA